MHDFPCKNIYKYGNINIFSVITTILDTQEFLMRLFITIIVLNK